MPFVPLDEFEQNPRFPHKSSRVPLELDPVINGGDFGLLGQVSGWVRPDTGVFPNIVISGSNTLSIPAGTGYIVNPTTGVEKINWVASTLELTGLDDGWITTVAIDNEGIPVGLAGNIDPVDARNHIILCTVTHLQGFLDSVQMTPAIWANVPYTAYDMSIASKNQKIQGGSITGNVVNKLALDISPKKEFFFGGAMNIIDDPNTMTNPLRARIMLYLSTAQSEIISVTDTLPVGFYNPNGGNTVEPIPAVPGSATAFRLYQLGDRFVCTYGQVIYTSLADCVFKAPYEYEAIPEFLDKAKLLAIICTNYDTSDLNDSNTTVILTEGFGSATSENNTGGGTIDLTGIKQDKYWPMHIGQLDWWVNNTVRQSVIIPQDSTIKMNDPYIGFNPTGAVTVVPYALSNIALPPFNLTPAVEYSAGLYKIEVAQTTEFIISRSYNDLVSPGINPGGTVIRGSTGRILNNLGRKGGSLKVSYVQSAAGDPYSISDGRVDSKPYLLKEGAYAGSLVSPTIMGWSSGPLQINIVEDIQNIDYENAGDHRIATMLGTAALGIENLGSYGCSVEYQDGDYIINLNRQYAGGYNNNFTLSKLPITPLDPLLPDTVPTASITVPFTFTDNFYGPKFRFRMLVLNSGNYFITWHDGSSYPNREVNCYYCVVDKELTTVLVNPTPIHLTIGANKWNAEIALDDSGNIIMVYMQSATNSDAPKMYAQVLDETGAVVVTPTLIRDYEDDASSNYFQDPLYSPQYSNASIHRLIVEGGSVYILSSVRGEDGGNSAAAVKGVFLDKLDFSLGVSVSKHFTNNSLFNPGYFVISSVPVPCVDMAVIDGSVYLVGQSGTIDNYSFYLHSLDADFNLKDSIQIKELPPLALSTNFNNEAMPVWVTPVNNGAYLRIDVFTNVSSMGNMNFTTLLYTDTLETVRNPSIDPDESLHLLLPGTYYIDSRYEWDNVGFRIASMNSTQMVLAEEEYEVSLSAYASKGTDGVASPHKFFVEYLSNSFIVGSGFYIYALDGQVFTGSLARIYIDLVRKIGSRYITVPFVGYIDLDTNGSFTQPQFITDLDILSGDVLQLRFVSLQGDMITIFKIAEATATLVTNGNLV